jgi:hypothetical protein
MALVLMSLAFMCLAQTPAHPNWVTFERTGPTSGTIRWASEPSLNVNYYYLATHPTTTQYIAPAYCDPNWNQPGGWASSFDSDAPGSFKRDVTLTDAGADYYAYVAAVETGGWSWSAYSSWEPPITLPVELSSFTATLTAQVYVKLNWVTQSETEMLGYRVYRGDNNNQASSILITPSLISATNTSTTQSYSVTDNEVSIGNTYWYWLESVDLASSDFHGPVSIIVEGDVPPVLPETTSLRNTYPNPFRMNGVTNIEVAVKAGENGSVTIYNILGQAVKTFNVSQGFHTLCWDGKDAGGRNCGSGVYFARLLTPSMSNVKKLLIIK